jgi:DNA-binding NtrC family response regulator
MSSALPPLLVVDDEKNMRLSLRTILSEEGYTPRLVESAEEALRLLEREPFFMVISDFRLGGMTGGQFLRQCHQRWPDLPVVLVTAYATPKLAAEAIKAGAFDYLPKPFEPEELLNVVARARSVTRCSKRTPCYARTVAMFIGSKTSLANRRTCRSCAN